MLTFFPPTVLQPDQALPLKKFTQSPASDDTAEQPISMEAACAHEEPGFAVPLRLLHPLQFAMDQVPPLKLLMYTANWSG